MLKRLKNIEDNLVEADDNDNKVGIFRIIKDIKDRGIKIDNDDEAVREIRERIKELKLIMMMKLLEKLENVLKN